jgi:hypothetical protein
MIQPTVNFDDLHDAIRSALATQFATAHVEFYDRPGQRIATPAILLEIEDIPVQDPDDVGTEQVPIDINCNAYCVLDYKAGNKQAVRAFAASVMAYILGKKWGQPVTRARTIGAFPDVIAGKEDSYEVMRVEWQHEGLLGADVWRLDHQDEDGDPLPDITEVNVSTGVVGSDPDAPETIQPCDCQ